MADAGTWKRAGCEFVRNAYVCGVLAVAAAVQACGYRPPRLPDGQVDLQGVWAHTNITPLERPVDFTTLVITPLEASELQTRILLRRENLRLPGEPTEYFSARGIEKIRGEFHSSVIVDPADGKIPGNEHFKTVLEAARTAVLKAFDGPEARPPAERCLSAITAQPPVTVMPSNDLRQIVQTPQVIVISSEELHETRIIRMNAQHAPAAVVSWLGDSIGWWEGTTLVIETKYFAPTSAARLGPLSEFLVGPSTTVTERITRASADELRYQFTVEDPTYYTRPWKGESRFGRSNDPILEFACHEGNYSLPFVLMGARALEAQPVAK
jgi:hypothetical protein